MTYPDVIKNLSKRGFVPFYFDDAASAVKKISELIPAGATVGFGGSVSVEEIGLLPALTGRTLLHRSLFPKEQASDVMKKMHFADWYVTSTNALTECGDFINIDGRANRVGEILNGPANIIYVLGTNKIVETIDEGIDRARTVAAVKNTRRLNKNTPCFFTGKCSYCNSPDTICKATVIQHHPTTDKTVYAIIINENLGY